MFRDDADDGALLDVVPTTKTRHDDDVPHVPRTVCRRHRPLRVLGQRAGAAAIAAGPFVQPHVTAHQPDRRRVQGPPGAAPSKSYTGVVVVVVDFSGEKTVILIFIIFTSPDDLAPNYILSVTSVGEWGVVTAHP